MLQSDALVHFLRRYTTPVSASQRNNMLLCRLATLSSKEASLTLERRRLATHLAMCAISVAKRCQNLKFGVSLMAQYLVVDGEESVRQWHDIRANEEY
jgi:hypothetical protein